jgi:hypothetical protein
MLWWTSSSSQTKSSEEATGSTHGFRYRVDDRQCEGELEMDSSCGVGMKGTGRDAPAIIEWTYKPVWEIRVPGLTQTARNKMLNVFQEVLEASVHCADDECSGNGAYAPDLQAWGSIDDTNGSNELFDGSRGDRCGRGRSVKVSLPENQSNWANDWDRTVEFFNGDPLFGMESEHHNHYADPKFKFLTLKVNEPDTNFVLKAGEQKTFESWWDQAFTFNYDMDKVVTGVSRTPLVAPSASPALALAASYVPLEPPLPSQTPTVPFLPNPLTENLDNNSKTKNSNSSTEMIVGIMAVLVVAVAIEASLGSRRRSRSQTVPTPDGGKALGSESGVCVRKTERDIMHKI